MSTPSTGVPARRARWHVPTRRSREQAAADARNLTLLSAGTGVPLGLVESNPELLSLAVDDLCRRLAVEDLDRRRPRCGDRAGGDAWRAEQARVEAERLRLAEPAAEAVSAL